MQRTYHEDEWIKAIFLLSDIQSWLQEAEKSLFYQLPISGKKQLFRYNYYLGCRAMAHILERHYYKISRHPNTGKFTIPLTEILSYIREAAHQTVIPVPGSVHVQRIIEAATAIGIDQYNQSTSTITIITDTGGHIITAFPGHL